MTTLEEITQRERLNTRSIMLYKEGIFFKAYERSAYAFTMCAAKFRPTKKRIKYLGDDVVSIGFPQERLDRYFDGSRVAQRDGFVEIGIDAEIDGEAFAQWKDSVPLKEPRLRTTQCAGEAVAESASAVRENGTGDKEREIVRMIREFRLEEATPLRCLTFVAELKQKVHGGI